MSAPAQSGLVQSKSGHRKSSNWFVRSTRWLTHRWHIVLISVGVLAVIVLGTPAVGLWLGLDPTKPVLNMWLLTLSGNWSPDAVLAPTEAYSHQTYWHRYGYSFFALLAVLLNNAVIVAVIGTIISVFVRGSSVMNLASTLTVRDEITKSAIKERIGQLKERLRYSEEAAAAEEAARLVDEVLDDAFAKGIEVWRERLATLFGRSQAERIVAALEQKIPEP